MPRDASLSDSYAFDRYCSLQSDLTTKHRHPICHTLGTVPECQNNTDQTYSCPRDQRHQLSQLRASLKPPVHNSPMVLRGIRGSPLCRETPGSRTANVLFSHLDLLHLHVWNIEDLPPRNSLSESSVCLYVCLIDNSDWFFRVLENKTNGKL